MRGLALISVGILSLFFVACSDDNKASEPKLECASTNSCAPADAGSDAGPSYTLIPGGPRFLGRVDTSDPAAPRFAWTGSGLVAVVSGSKIAITLKNETSELFYQPVIDGVPGARFSVPAGEPTTTVLGSALSEGDHVVELYRENEALFGDSIFLGFADGTVKGAPAGTNRVIEVVGDSITGGGGNLGEESHVPPTSTCFFSLATQSAYQSYGLQLGRLLDAEASLIAYSGWGMYRGSGGNTASTLPSVYANTLGDKPAPAWSFTRKVDAVVVNLGTNDASTGDPGVPYETAYLAFLQTIRSHYADAWIFLTVGPMFENASIRQHLANIVTAAGDPKVVKVDLLVQAPSPTGCDGHPNVAEHQRMANTLAPLLKAKLGW